MASMVQFAQTINQLNAMAPLMPSANGEPLTTDAIILMCSSRLRSLDDQIKTNLNKQETYRNCTAKLNSAQTVLAGAGASQGLHTTADFERVESGLDAAIDAAPEGEVKDNLIQLRKDFKENAADGKMNAQECSAYAQRAQDISKQINSAAELDMITVNSLMSQRQTAVQLFNNLLTAEGETQKSLAASIGK